MRNIRTNKRIAHSLQWTCASCLSAPSQAIQPLSAIEHDHITTVLGKQLHSECQLALTQQWLPHTKERDSTSTAPSKAVALAFLEFLQVLDRRLMEQLLSCTGHVILLTFIFTTNKEILNLATRSILLHCSHRYTKSPGVTLPGTSISRTLPKYASASLGFCHVISRNR